MAKWKTKSKNLGNLTVGRKQIIKFYAEEELQEIISLSSSCGCSKPNYDKKTRILNVAYKPKSIPQQRKHLGFYKTTKSITIKYKDGSTDILSFSAIINKK